MATLLADGSVLFAGMYPASSITSTETLQRQISCHYQKAKKVPAHYQLFNTGLQLTMTVDNSTGSKTIKIPMQSIRDITVNPYSPVCLMTIFSDQKGRTNFLVCQCQREQGAAKVVHNFRRFKQSVTGEGYKIDLKKPEGHNWTLKTNEERRQDAQGSTEGSMVNGHPPIPREPEEVQRTPNEAGGDAFDVAVQADTGDSDSVSIASSATMRDEILKMSQEVRDIQNQLQNTMISQTEYIGTVDTANGHGPSDGEPNNNINNNNKEADGQHSDATPEAQEPKASSSDGDSETTEKRVNFDPVRTVIKPTGYVSRSYGVQTERKRHKYAAVQPPPGSLRFSHGQQRGWILFRSRSRSASSSSNPPSPHSPGHDAHNDVFEGAPTRGGSTKRSGALPLGPKSTVVRSIEHVYPMTVRHTRPRRPHVMLRPNSISSVARRTSSNSSGGGDGGVPTGNPLPIRPVSFHAHDGKEDKQEEK